MIPINTVYTEDALKIHREELFKLIKSKIFSSQLPVDFKNELYKLLNEILTAKPNRLLELNAEINNQFIKSKKKREKFNPKIRKIFDYNLFTIKCIKYNVYQLAENLKIDCCPNCNRQYTITINSKRKSGQLTRPDFDHYFPKSKFPLLALSFYNLIPSCKICNSTFKGTSEMDLNKYLHPYIDNVIKEFEFDYTLSKTNRCDKIELKYNSEKKDKIKNTLELFKIEDIYNGHKFIVDNILKLKNELNDDYLEILTKHTYKEIEWTPEEAYAIAFGSEYKDDELYKHPFSKFKKDILSKEDMLSIFKK